jgi:hypothetical protein
VFKIDRNRIAAHPLTGQTGDKNSEIISKFMENIGRSELESDQFNK